MVAVILPFLAQREKLHKDIFTHLRYNNTDSCLIKPHLSISCFFFVVAANSYKIAPMIYTSKNEVKDGFL